MLRKFGFIVVFSLFFCHTYSIHAQNRAVAIVYDNSRSMQDAGQCEGVNYALQVMIGLLHAQDELYVYRMEPAQGNRIDLQQKRVAMQNASTEYTCAAGRTPFGAILQAANNLSTSSKKSKWLIILSDGDITDNNFEATAGNRLRGLVENTGTRIIFLNVNSKQSKLDSHLNRTATPNNTLRTQGSFEQIINTMENIAGNVMTLSKGGIKTQAQGNKVTLQSPIPLKKIILLAQSDQKNNQLPQLKIAVGDKKNLYIEPAYKAQKAKGDYEMSGIITHVKSGTNEAIIPSSTLTFEFDKAVDVQKIKFLPEAAAKLEVQIKGGFKKEGGNTFTVCDSLKNVTIVAQLLDLNNQALAESVLQSARVEFVNELTKQRVRLQYQPKTKDFSAPIPLSQDRTMVSVEAEYVGYFNYQSNVFVVNKAFCAKPQASIQANAPTITAKVTDLANAPSIIVTPQIKVGDLPLRPPTEEELQQLYFEQPSDTRLRLDISQEGGKLVIRPVANICACFTPTGTEKIALQLKSRNKQIEIAPNSTLQLTVTVADDSFWAKCGALIVGVLGTLFLLWYLWGIYKKPRFCRGAEVIYTKTTPLVQRKPQSYLLPTSFVNRYLVPYLPEKQVVGGVLFKAGARCSHILIADESQNERMYISGFPIDKPKEKDLRLSNGEKLEVTGQGNSKEVYEYRKI
ncbi:MAG: hypothetical protein JNM36_03850 [Chitinophagales bacterium]|nr:hypothetical protein [Chitinophagales bacterium]